MLRRLSGRLLTGPVAFLIGGLVDLALLSAAALRARGGRRPA